MQAQILCWRFFRISQRRCLMDRLFSWRTPMGAVLSATRPLRVTSMWGFFFPVDVPLHSFRSTTRWCLRTACREVWAWRLTCETSVRHRLSGRRRCFAKACASTHETRFFVLVLNATHSFAGLMSRTGLQSFTRSVCEHS